MIVEGEGFPSTEEEYWLNVMDSVTLSGLPVQYMNSISVFVNNGSYYHVDINYFFKNKKDISYIEDGLDRIFSICSGRIKDVSVNMNTKKVIKDVKKAVKNLQLN